MKRASAARTRTRAKAIWFMRPHAGANLPSRPVPHTSGPPGTTGHRNRATGRRRFRPDRARHATMRRHRRHAGPGRRRRRARAVEVVPRPLRRGRRLPRHPRRRPHRSRDRRRHVRDAPRPRAGGRRDRPGDRRVPRRARSRAGARHHARPARRRDRAVVAARAVGAMCVAVTTGDVPRDVLHAEGADVVFDSLSPLVDWYAERFG
jgi:hypothetical protein